MDDCRRLEYDFVVVGSGVAGLWTAIHLADAGRVAVVTKDIIRQGSTPYAQGGIAVALSADDEPELHLRDTLAAGDGLCDVPACEILTYEGPAAVQELIEFGAEFDRKNGDYAFGREAAHSQRRILHSDGDATGAEIERALVACVEEAETIDVYEYTQAVHLLIDDGRCVGLQAIDLQNASSPLFFTAKATAIATGGVGCLYRVTTNPPVVTADGITMAYRAGAQLKDAEFVQFHPTALAAPGFPKFLLSEALRGDGAKLLNHKGEAFMRRYSAMGDLAPRDQVARAVMQEMKAAHQPFVYLDLEPIGRDRVDTRFPSIVQECRDKGFLVPDEPVPACPAAHYYMGGIDVNVDCQSSIPGLYAVGECACVSVHGANRLASNSLLEGVVFGPRAARAMTGESELDSACVKRATAHVRPSPVGHGLYHDLRDIMWDNMGVIRSDSTLRNAVHGLEVLQQKISQSDKPNRSELETANALLMAKIMTFAAINRRESRGAHYRVGFEDKVDGLRQHSIVVLGEDGQPELSYRPVELQRTREPD